MRKINEAHICVIHTSYIIHTIQSSDIIEHEKNAVLLLAYFVYNSTLKSAPHIESIKALRSVFKIFAFSDFSASLLWMRTQLLNSCGSLLLLCWTCCWLHQRKQININSSLREKYRKILNNSLFYKLKIAANEFICCFLHAERIAHWCQICEQIKQWRRRYEFICSSSNETGQAKKQQKKHFYKQ